MPHNNTDIEELRCDLSEIEMEGEAEIHIAHEPSWRPDYKFDPEADARYAEQRARASQAHSGFSRMKGRGLTHKEMVKATLKLSATEVAKFVSAFLHDVGEGRKGFRLMSSDEWNRSELHMFAYDRISVGFMVIVEEGVGSLNYPKLNEMLASLGWQLSGDWEEEWTAHVEPLEGTLPGLLSSAVWSVGDTSRDGDVSDMPELHIRSGCQDCDFERGDPCMEHR